MKINKIHWILYFKICLLGETPNNCRLQGGPSQPMELCHGRTSALTDHQTKSRPRGTYVYSLRGGRRKMTTPGFLHFIAHIAVTVLAVSLLIPGSQAFSLPLNFFLRRPIDTTVPRVNRPSRQDIYKTDIKKPSLLRFDQFSMLEISLRVFIQSYLIGFHGKEVYRRHPTQEYIRRLHHQMWSTLSPA